MPLHAWTTESFIYSLTKSISCAHITHEWAGDNMKTFKNPNGEVNYGSRISRDYHREQDDSYRSYMDSDMREYKALMKQERSEQRRRNKTARKVALAIGAAAAAVGAPALAFADGPAQYQTGVPNDGYVDIVILPFENANIETKPGDDYDKYSSVVSMSSISLPRPAYTR